MMVNGGLFIVIDGMDGSGKTTMVKALRYAIHREYGVCPVITTEPTNGEVGKLLRKLLSSDYNEPLIEAMLFAADRKEHTDEIILQLNRGNVVISDRYILSSLCYQSIQGVDVDKIFALNEDCWIIPDLYIVLNCDTNTAMDRLAERTQRDKFERKWFLNALSTRYPAYIDFLSNRHDVNCKVIDASRPQEEVLRAIMVEVGKIWSK